MGHSYTWSFFLLILLSSYIVQARVFHWNEDFSSCTLRYWTSDVNATWHSSDIISGKQEDNNSDVLLALQIVENEAHLYFKQSFHNIENNSKLSVNITVLGCNYFVYLNVSGENVMQGSAPSYHEVCTDNLLIPLVYTTTIANINELNMTLFITGPRHMSSRPHLLFISRLEVLVQSVPSEATTTKVLRWLEDFSLCKLQYWTIDTDDWNFVPSSTHKDMLLSLHLSPTYPITLNFHPDRIINKHDLMKSAMNGGHLTVNITVLGCNSYVDLYWESNSVLQRPIDDECEDDLSLSLEFSTEIMRDQLGLMMLVYGPSNISRSTVMLISKLEVLLVTQNMPIIKDLMLTSPISFNDYDVEFSTSVNRQMAVNSMIGQEVTWFFIGSAIGVCLILSIALIALICKRKDAIYQQLRSVI